MLQVICSLHLTLTSYQTVHGGLILSLTDTLGSLAVATKGQFMTGVSTDIATSFVKPAGRIGDTLYARAYLIAMGHHSQIKVTLAIADWHLFRSDIGIHSCGLSKC
jgi:uncharacterized protein (TIGR00369 family)